MRSLLLLPLLMLAGCGIVSDADKKIFSLEDRQPTEQERLFHHLGLVMQSAKPCYLIDERRVTGSGFNPVGQQVSHLRSSCLRGAALHSGNPEFCRDVISVSTAMRSGATLNREHCERDARHSNARISVSLDIDAVVALLGYSTDELDHLLTEAGRFSSVEVARRYRTSYPPHIYRAEIERHVLHAREFFDRLNKHAEGIDPASREAMLSVPYAPRFIRPFPPPEQRTTGPAELRIMAGDQDNELR